MPYSLLERRSIYGRFDGLGVLHSMNGVALAHHGYSTTGMRDESHAGVGVFPIDNRSML
jgi:hypothetical protein